MIGMFMSKMHPEINSIDALPMYLVTYLPEWLGGIGLGAILISAMGSLSGLALGVGTMISRDLVKNIWKSASSTNLLWASRISVLLVTICAIVFVFFHLDSSVLEWNYLSMALRGSGIFLPLTFAVFFPGKVNRKFGIMAIIGGIAVACLWKYIAPWKINGLFPALACNLLFLIPGLLVKKDE
jgi:SSS family solute:Na+ symporter